MTKTFVILHFPLHPFLLRNLPSFSGEKKREIIGLRHINIENIEFDSFPIKIHSLIVSLGIERANQQHNLSEATTSPIRGLLLLL